MSPEARSRHHSLCAQGEGRAGDGGGQVETLGDFSPNLLVDHLDQAAARHHELVQLVQVEHLLRHYRNAINWSACVRYETRPIVIMIEVDN